LDDPILVDQMGIGVITIRFSGTTYEISAKVSCNGDFAITATQEML
jgi:hypothetical protein